MTGTGYEGLTWRERADADRGGTSVGTGHGGSQEIGIVVRGGGGRPVVVVSAVPAATGETVPEPTDTSNGFRPPQGTLTIEVETIIGSGCSADTAAVVVDPDNTFFRVVYSSYLAETGPEVPRNLARRNCQIALNPRYPLGEYTFAVDLVLHEGRVSLTRGAWTRFRASEYYAGASGAEPANRTIVGPLADRWIVVDEREEKWLVWRPCGCWWLNLAVRSSFSGVATPRGAGAR